MQSALLIGMRSNMHVQTQCPPATVPPLTARALLCGASGQPRSGASGFQCTAAAKRPEERRRQKERVAKGGVWEGAGVRHDERAPPLPFATPAVKSNSRSGGQRDAPWSEGARWWGQKLRPEQRLAASVTRRGRPGARLVAGAQHARSGRLQIRHPTQGFISPEIPNIRRAAASQAATQRKAAPTSDIGCCLQAGPHSQAALVRR
jgi:hypothetical protein